MNKTDILIQRNKNFYNDVKKCRVVIPYNYLGLEGVACPKTRINGTIKQVLKGHI